MTNDQEREHELLSSFVWAWDLQNSPAIAGNAPQWVTQLCNSAYAEVFEPRTRHADALLFQYARALKMHSVAIGRVDFQAILKNAKYVAADISDTIPTPLLLEWLATPDTNRYAYCDNALKDADTDTATLRDVIADGYLVWANKVLDGASKFLDMKHGEGNGRNP